MDNESTSEVKPARSVQRVESAINQRTENDPATRAKLTTMARMIVPTLSLDLTSEQRRVFNGIAKLAGEKAKREIEEQTVQDPVQALDNILYEISQQFQEGDIDRLNLHACSRNLRISSGAIHDMVERIQTERELDGRPASVDDVFREDLNEPDSLRYLDNLQYIGSERIAIIEPILRKLGLLTDKATLADLVKLYEKKGQWTSNTTVSGSNISGFTQDPITTNVPGVSVDLIAYKPNSIYGQNPEVRYGLSCRLDRDAVIRVAKAPRGENAVPPPPPRRRIY